MEKNIANFLANWIAWLWWQRSFSPPCPPSKAFLPRQVQLSDFFHYALITLRFGKIQLKLASHFSLSFSKLPQEQTGEIAVVGIEGGGHSGGGLPAWDFSGVDEKKNWGAFLSFTPLFLSWPQLLQKNFDETGTRVRAAHYPGVSERQFYTWQSYGMARYAWDGPVLPWVVLQTDRVLGIT